MTARETKKALYEIPDIMQFERILERVTLSGADKDIIRLHYIEDMPLYKIAEKQGYSEAEIYDRHGKALKKIGKVI